MYTNLDPSILSSFHARQNFAQAKVMASWEFAYEFKFQVLTQRSRHGQLNYVTEKSSKKNIV
jgi:hypothetical protein